MGFWEGDTGKLETLFRLLIFNIIISHCRTFQSVVLHLVLSCVIKNVKVVLEKKHGSVRPRNPMGCIIHSLCLLTDISSIRYYM